ncbi:MAG: tetratricopeptide repeat protein, partial [Deltaproteobacteria bacterium]
MEAQQVAQRHRTRAGVALDLGRFAVAEREARAALAANPRDVTAQLYLCRAYLGMSEYDRAIAAARGAIGLAPGDGYAYYLAGFAMQVAGRANEAVDMLRESVRLMPSAARFHARLAIALLDARDRAGARASIDAAIGLDPDNTGLIDEAARVYGLLDALALAEDLARRLVRLEPDALAILRSHSWPGNVRELEHWIESAIALGPDGRVTAAQLPARRGPRA